MSNSNFSNIDHDEYARIGRQLQAQEARVLFLGLKDQIKKFFSGNSDVHSHDLATGQKC